MSRITYRILFAAVLIAFVTSCSKGLEVLIYNNTNDLLVFTFESGDTDIRDTLKVREKLVFQYGDIRLPAEITVITDDCERSYILPSPVDAYDESILGYSDGEVYQLRLQIQNNFEIFFATSNSELPFTKLELDNQPKDVFPLRSVEQSGNCRS